MPVFFLLLVGVVGVAGAWMPILVPCVLNFSYSSTWSRRLPPPQLHTEYHRLVLHVLFYAQSPFEQNHSLINCNLFVGNVLSHEGRSNCVDNTEFFSNFVAWISRCVRV